MLCLFLAVVISLSSKCALLVFNIENVSSSLLCVSIPIRLFTSPITPYPLPQDFLTVEDVLSYLPDREVALITPYPLPQDFLTVEDVLSYLPDREVALITPIPSHRTS